MATQTQQLNYVLYAYLDLLEQIQNVLKQSSQWKDLLESSTGTVLIEFYCYIANVILYYVERTAEELYLPTAQRKSSLVNLVSLLNYIPKRKISAIGNVTFSLSSPATVNITIPAKTKVQTSTGYYYSTIYPATIFVGQSSVTVSVIQGYWVPLSYVSDGSINQTYQIFDTDVENNNLNVLIDSVSWSAVSSFISSVNNSLVYRLTHNLDDTLTIVFGDNVTGQAPGNGSDISISYLRSDGLLGNVYSAAIINTIVDTITDVEGTTVTTISVTNASPILGGADAETIEEIRDRAPKVFSTGDRFVTKADGIAILNDYPSVASSNVWGEAENTPPNYTEYNQVTLSLILQNWTLPSTDFKTTLSTYLYTKAPLTIRFSYLDPTVVQVIPLVTLYVSQGYSLSSIQSAVETVLGEQFKLGTKSLIGTNIRFATVISAIQAIPGIAWCHLTLQAMKQMTYHLTSGNDYGGTLDLLPIKAATAKIYVGSTLYAIDDGVGGWTSSTSGTVVTGSINYTTGAVIINFAPDVATNSVVTVRYQQNNEGDLEVTKSQILQYNSSVQTLSYA
jgi:hypothetical protein